LLHLWAERSKVKVTKVKKSINQFWSAVSLLAELGQLNCKCDRIGFRTRTEC